MDVLGSPRVLGLDVAIGAEASLAVRLAPIAYDNHVCGRTERVCRRQFDSLLEGAGFEPSVHRAAGAIETRALRRMLSDSEVDSKVKGRTI
jgi:hypothetical protein